MGQGGDENSPATQAAAADSGGSKKGSTPEYRTQETMAQPRNQDNGSVEERSGGGEGEHASTLLTYTSGARTEHGTSCKYGLLALEDPKGD